MFLVVILLLFPVGKKSNFIAVIMVDNKYCQLHPYFYSFYFQFSSSSLQGRFSQVVPLNCKGNKEASEYLHVISNVWTALQKDLLDLIFKTLVQLMLLFTKCKL